MVKSAVRVFELLEMFEAERRPLRVADIVERLGAPQSSVSMLLKSLVARGYMEFDAAKREYCPSIRISFLGDWTTRMPDRPEAIQDAMRRLAAETGETVLLGRQSGLQLQYLSVIESQHALRFSPSPGTMRPIHRSAIGILLMSQLEDEQIGLLLRRYNAEVGRAGHPAKIAETLRAVALARDQGHYESANLATTGAGVIAALVQTLIRGQRLGLGIGAPIERLHRRRKQLLSAVLAAAKKC